MDVNADFGRPVIVQPQTGEGFSWTASPAHGVDRIMLDRVGGEVARATSLVRYAAGSRFAAHVHGGGEEFVVLDGVFQDEHGDYPAGTYVRNPPTSSHTPRSDAGCIIFVKLWQFEPDDREHVVSDVGRGVSGPTWLYRSPVEEVLVQRLYPGETMDLAAAGGAEVFVLDGHLSAIDISPGEAGDFPALRGRELDRHGWLRAPVGSTLALSAGEQAGASLWLKLGNVRHAHEQAGRVRAASAA